MKKAGLKAGLKMEVSLAERIGTLADSIEESANRLESVLTRNDSAGILEEMRAMREKVDALERHVDDDLWPLPKYREMLFIL